MGPLSYMLSVVDRNFVMLRISVISRNISSLHGPHTVNFTFIFGIRQQWRSVNCFRDGGSVVSAIEKPSIYTGRFRSKKETKDRETLKEDRRT
jgi:hypothetical protein